ncbi:SHOCT domain-containing protein [Luteimonas sp. FCS-9]|uniref:SHOCT domain-containing protein n=1 Tax=Luteimonas sp. FCS-9 TaxID=1547516 RepID=UPI00069AC619|nr:SHOCT domain-containing protein [Luteimonas sp. FCS-9]
MLKSVAAGLIVLVCALPTSAIAVRIAHEDYPMRVPAAAGDGQVVTLTVIDSRPYVLDGDSKESYEGMTRELYGIPISRNTADNSPMASYLGERLRLGFEQAGYAATYEPSVKGTASDVRARSLTADGVDLIFLVTLKEWSYDQGFANPEFTHDVVIDVYTGAGHLLSSEAFNGVDPMPTGGWKHYKRRYAELYQDVFDRMFASQNLVAGLAGRSTIPAPDMPKGPSIESRLETLGSVHAQGLIDEETFKAQQARILLEL